MKKDSTPQRTSPLLAALVLAGSMGAFLAALAAVVVAEELLYGPFGPVARFYRRTGIDQVFEIISDGFAWLFA